MALRHVMWHLRLVRIDDEEMRDSRQAEVAGKLDLGIDVPGRWRQHLNDDNRAPQT
jgi:hypothetical protein